MALQVLNGPIIAAGEALSDGLDLTLGDPVRFTMPADWDGGNLTFQISTDGAFYNDLVDVRGDPVTIAVVPGAAVVIAQFADYFRAINYIKFRAGTADHPVIQNAQREFAVAIETYEEAPPAARRQESPPRPAVTEARKV